MKTMNLEMPPGMDYGEAQKAARDAALEVGGDVALVSYYDRARNKMVPEAVSSKEEHDGHRIYAESRGADIRVTVNDDEYDFFFLSFGDDVLS
jgi:hypothetical protein